MDAKPIWTQQGTTRNQAGEPVQLVRIACSSCGWTLEVLTMAEGRRAFWMHKERHAG